MNRFYKEDLELLARCLAGNKKASENLVRRFSNLVYESVQYTLMVKHVSFNRHDLEDLHNTVFLKLFEQDRRKLRQYQGKRGCSVATWIKTIAVRTVLDHLRKKGVDAITFQKDRVPLEKLPELKADWAEFGTEPEKVKQNYLVQAGMKRLSPRERLFMKLHFDQALSMAEVAEIMQLSIGNIYTIKYRAIQKIKSHVTSDANIDI
jgi:RNA polymerase sigma factor (sigma-70 family)